MPIFEYVCRKCQHQFEVLVQGTGAMPECPACHSKKLEKQLSVFAATTGGRNTGARALPLSACGTCGDPRGPGSCSRN